MPNTISLQQMLGDCKTTDSAFYEKQKAFLLKGGYKLDDDINEAKDDMDGLVLHYAIACGRVGLVKLLVDHKVDIDRRDEHCSDGHIKGMTPLGAAVFYGSERVVQLLLDRKADAAKCDHDGYSPLMLAAKHGNRKMLPLLLDAKVDINQENQIEDNGYDHGMTALMYASRSQSVRTAKWLIDRGASIRNSQDENFIACCSNEKRRAELRSLLQKTEPTVSPLQVGMYAKTEKVKEGQPPTFADVVKRWALVKP